MHTAIALAPAALLAGGIIVIGSFYILSPERSWEDSASNCRRPTLTPGLATA